MAPLGSFMLTDLRDTLVALPLYAPLLLLPGWALGAWSDVFGFRGRSLLGRCALALCLSLALTPLALDLLVRALGPRAVLAYAIAAAVACLAVGLRSSRVPERAAGETKGEAGRLRVGAGLAPPAAGPPFETPPSEAPQGDRVERRGPDGGPAHRDAQGHPMRPLRSAHAPGVWLWLPLLAWPVLAALSLCDLQIGSDLYLSVTAIDYVKHIGVTDAILRTGVPPENPFFHPGAGVGLYYYYYWHLVCAAAGWLGSGLVATRGIVFAGTIWAGYGFLAMLGLVARLGRGEAADGWRTIYRRMLLLACVAGLDLIGVLPANLLCLLRHAVPVYECGESWNEQVTMWLGQLLWVPQHIGASVAWTVGLTACRRAEGQGRRRQLVAGGVLALAVASAIGLSVWVSLAFGLCALAWVAARIAGTRRLGGGALACLAGCIVGCVVALPFLLRLASIKAVPGLGIGFHVRSFLPLVELYDIAGIGEPWRSLSMLALLPINYAMEFGLFALVAVVAIRGRRLASDPDRAWEVTSLVTALVLVTFVRSTIRCNDLGWRGMIPAQLVLLLWGAEWLPELLRGGSRRRRLAAWTALLLGVSFTVGELANLRLHHVARERVPLRPVELPGETLREARELYRAVRAATTPGEVVQANPRPLSGLRPDFFGALYGGRPSAVSGGLHGAIFGIPPEVYVPTEDEVASIFSGRDPRDAIGVARRYGIAVLVFEEGDPTWSDPDSWIWHAPALVESPRFRAIRVP